MGPLMTDFVNKLLAAALFFLGLLYLFGGAGADAGLFSMLCHWAKAIFVMGTAVGFFKQRGWAFLVVSVGLLVGWFVSFIRFVLAFEGDQGLVGPLALVLVMMALIAWLGRWSMEKRFRPHLDSVDQ